VPGPTIVNCDIEELDARPKSDLNYDQAFIIKQALLDESVPTRSVSGLWLDKNGKPMVGYFADSDVQVNAHSAPVGQLIFLFHVLVLKICVYRNI